MSFEPDADEPPALLAPLFYAAEGLFGAAGALRRGLYGAKLLRVGRVDVPVVSVGNIAVGGSGKTPFTRHLADRLSERRVAIVSRGYGRRDRSKSVVVVSRGEGPIVSVDASGDEPFWLAENTGARVVVSADRVLGARHAVAALDAEIIILDDGFQHLAIHRDLDIVMLDARRPFGNERLLPRGPLREPSSSLARAGLIVLNHGAERFESVDSRVTESGVPIVDVEVISSATTPIDGQPIALMTGIARPERVRTTAEALGADVVLEDSHPDHAWFESADVELFVANAEAAGATVLVTTEKDLVRIPEAMRERFAVIRIEHEVVGGEESLAAALRALRTPTVEAAVG